MHPAPEDLAFVRFQRTGRPDALGDVFDRTAADLLRVAAHLAPDVHSAEDLVQETFLVAIEDRATFTPGRGVAAWLVGILRNRARRRWREKARRGDGAEAVAESLARDGDPEAEVRTLELTAEVDAAVQQLAQTYRPVLRLHLRHGLSPAEIALALDRPAGSVRTQLGRGLALLRTRLPRGLALGTLALVLAPRSLAALRASVVDAATRAIVTATVPAAAVGLITASLAFPMKKLVLGGAALALAVLTGAWHFGAFAAPDTPTSPEASATLRVAAAPVAPTSTPTTPDSPAPSPARELVPAPTRTGRQYGSLLVRARWKDDETPAPEVTVVLFDWSKPNPFLTTRAGVTGADGTLRLERVLAGKLSVVTDDDEWRSVEVAPDAEATVDVFQPRWAQVRGVVLDAAGTPVAGATVVRSEDMNHTLVHPLARTDADGRFAFALGQSQHVGARLAGWQDSYLTHLRAQRGETVEVTLRLRGRAGAIAGVVRDARGAPVHGALVTAGSGGSTSVLADGTQVTTTPPPMVRTGADGAFRLDGLVPGPTPLLARALDCGAARHDLVVAAGETREVAVVLHDAAVIEGRVVDATGRAVEGATVAVGGYASFTSSHATTRADGTFHLDSVPPGQHAVGAGKEKVGRATTTLDLRAGATAQWEATLVARPTVRGRIVDEAGVPVAPAWVSVASLDINESRTVHATATDGAFAIECPQDEPLRLRVQVQADTFPSVEMENVLPGDEVLTVTVPAATRPTARVRGVLVACGAADLRTAFVHLQRGPRGLGTGFELDPETGTFALGPFPPGDYRVTVTARDRPTMHLGVIHLDAGATLDLGRVRIGEAGSLRAEVTGEDGKPLPTGHLMVLLRDGSHVSNGEIKDGVARIAQLAPGDYLVHTRDAGIGAVTVRAGEEATVGLRPRAGPLRDVTVRETPRPQHPPSRWIEVDMLDATGVLVDRVSRGNNGVDTWRLRVAAPPEGTLVVKADGRERMRVPIPAEGPIEVGLR